LALILNAVDPAIGGVLLRGQKGSAKSTLARGIAALLPGKAPFVELPVGATEDRLVGTLDIEGALGEGKRRFQPGLLHAADGGVLYVDEVNLLPDHLVDVLLDVADTVVRLCAAVGAEGLRADLVICRAAAALAGWEGRGEADENDVRRVAHLALAHRRRRSPFEEPGMAPEEVEEALNRNGDSA